MSKLRRQREFATDDPIQSSLPTADQPHSRAVESKAADGDFLRLEDLPIDAATDSVAIEDVCNRIICGDSERTLAHLPDESIALAITSPPYWNTVDYGFERQIGPGSYDDYRARLLDVWHQVARCLRPNGKFALNVPLMPIRKAVSAEHFGKTHTRVVLDLYADLKHDILVNTGLLFYSLYIWEKQTTEKMFGSYPFPGNLYERNYIEFIAVFVKPGKPPKFPKPVKEAARLTSEEWMELTKQIWWMFPANVKRAKGHPAPFPEALPNRLISMYTFPQVGDHPGDVVLDPLAGWGTTCVAAKRLGRPTIGIDGSSAFCAEAARRLAATEREPKIMQAVRPTERRQPEPAPEPAEPEPQQDEAVKCPFCRKVATKNAAGVVQCRWRGCKRISRAT
jgi:DNA modification methylase